MLRFSAAATWLYAVPFALAGFVAVVVAPGCADETIVLATISTVDGGSSSPPPPTRCVDSSECTNGYYCAKTLCTDQTGTCTLPPQVCPSSEQPVCGCDNITYFNDCLRQANGVAASSMNPCIINPVLCGGQGLGACPDGGSLCAQLGGFSHGPCGDDLPGTCWMLPAQCPDPDSNSGDLWDSCQMNGPQCLDTCRAILGGGGYHRSQRCP